MKLEDDEFVPIIEIGEGRINAHYYKDLSGEISIEDNDGEQLFFRDDGKLKHHIEYLEEAIDDLKKDYQIKLKSFHRAIVLLKQEQILLKVKKMKK